MGETVAQSLARRGLGREVWDQDLVFAIVLCSWAKHFTRTMPLSTWECKWVPANFQENMIGNAGGGGVTYNEIASHLIELAVILVDKHKHRLCLFVNSYNIT